MKKHDKEHIHAVLFDFDGTLTQGSALNFTIIRQALGCPNGVSVLDFIETLTTSEARREAVEKLNAFEGEAAARSYPNENAVELLSFLRKRKIPYGILTSNCRENVIRSMNNFPEGTIDTFAFIITRDDDVEIKPSASGVHHAADLFGVTPEELLFIGDYLHDVQAGINAGACTVFLDAGENSSALPGSDVHRQAVDNADYTVNNLIEFQGLLDWIIPLLPGKVPNRLLKEILANLSIEDTSIILGPGVGEDAAVVELPLAGSSEVPSLVFKSDPITFVGEHLGRYAVTINANDIATTGAKPRWLLVDGLFPPGTTAENIRDVVCDFAAAAKELGVTVCGGHSEITDAVSRSVLSGFLVGTVARNELMRKQDMRQGDVILMTKTVGCEGTGILAREFADTLYKNGMMKEEIKEASGFTEHISILPEAKIAAASGMVNVMHDVTEGGIAAAVWELSAAGGHTLTIDMDLIPVSKITARICRAVGIDPLGLIGSGSLLIISKPEGAEGLLNDLHETGIQVGRIGTVGESGTGIKAFRDGVPAEWPEFETDELTRLYEKSPL